MMLSVGQLARMTGLTVRALHHYDARGLLVPSQRSDAGYRLYSQADVVRLYRIQALQRLGLSLADIAAALDRDSSSLPALVAQQLGELDEQIARSTLVRDQLRRLQLRLEASDGPTATEWLRALELLATYDKHCSAEDMQRLLAHNNDSDWPPFIRDVRNAMDRRIDPSAEEARALAHRWARLAMGRFGGDLTLATKMKKAYLDNASVQTRVEAQSGFDAQMMQFCLHITTQAHLDYWKRHLDHEEVNRLVMSGAWARDWPGVAKELNQRSASDGSADPALLEKWNTVLLAFAGGHRDLKEKVESALRVDPDLREFWSIGLVAIDAVQRTKDATQ